ncbi:MAG: response regulator [Candidatus Omnitrophica bacterium]|nr:response regulator [Candidatus Omnitrophota bacterium]
MGLKILLADAEPNVALLLENCLKANGFEVVSAMDGVTALEKAREERPSLIVLDPILPKMDGFQVCGLLKADAQSFRIPIVMLTARSPECGVQRDGKADAYIARPFEPRALLAAIEGLISRCSQAPSPESNRTSGR